MTTPVERLRSIGWGAGLLDALELDADLPDDMRVWAGKLNDRYPTPDKLHALIDAEPVALPAELAEAIGNAAQLFVHLQRGDQGGPDTRRQITYVLRHFPAKPDLVYCTDPFPSWCIADWIQADRVGEQEGFNNA